MRTEIDLDAASRAGIIGEDTAIALRNFQAQQDGVSAASAEKFQLFGGYADLVSALGTGLVLVAMWMAAVAWHNDLSVTILIVPMIAAIAFILATRADLRASPALGFVLMIAFLVSFATTPLAFAEVFDLLSPRMTIVKAALMGAATFIGTAIFWRSFRFPPTLAFAISGFSLILIEELTKQYHRRMFFETGETATLFTTDAIPALIALAIALVTLVWAIWYDISDVRRETERSQTAFWLHCCAGFLLTRALFSLLTGAEVINDTLVLTGLEAHHVPLLFLMMFGAAFISLLLDRRSLLTGVLLPICGIFGSQDGAVAAGMMMAGISLLFFNWGWVRMRIALLSAIPAKLEAQLPRTNLALLGQRPTRRHAELSPAKPGARLR
ncbi:hypothetical protein [Aurantiacibacter sp. MUD61]|uniref:hypothetical protein n=1 Tax=Aurantiacibacter sp. MUD61 TaxID=3009083 RepID=UPI0022F05664|nr:hypothetical protein [Aurantiacibacter sp. MUD61]